MKQKKTKTITESQLRKMIAESVQNVLMENSRDEYDEYLIQKFLETGECDSTDTLIAIIKKCDENTAKKAAEAFKQSCENMRYIDPQDYSRTANTYAKQQSNYPQDSIENRVYGDASSYFKGHKMNPHRN